MKIQHVTLISDKKAKFFLLLTVGKHFIHWFKFFRQLIYWVSTCTKTFIIDAFILFLLNESY